MSDLNERLKQLIDDVDLDRRLNELVDRGEELFQVALSKAGAYVHEHREDIDRTFDKLADRASDRAADVDGPGDRWSERVDQVRDRLELGLDRLAERRPEDDEPDA